MYRYTQAAPAQGAAKDIRELRGTLLEDDRRFSLSQPGEVRGGSYQPLEDDADVVSYEVLRERSRATANKEAGELQASNTRKRQELRGHRERVVAAQKTIVAVKEEWREVERERMEREQQVVRIHKQMEEEEEEEKKLEDETKDWEKKERAERRAARKLEKWVAQLEQQIADTQAAFDNEHCCRRCWNAFCWRIFRKGWPWKEGGRCYRHPLKEWRRKQKDLAEKEAAQRYAGRRRRSSRSRSGGRDTEDVMGVLGARNIHIGAGSGGDLGRARAHADRQQHGHGPNADKDHRIAMASAKGALEDTLVGDMLEERERDVNDGGGYMSDSGSSSGGSSYYSSSDDGRGHGRAPAR
eukprot:g3854.t1